MPRLAALILALLGALPVIAQQPATAADSRELLDLEYADNPRAAQQNRLDLYLPATPAPHALVVYVHGGSWTVGSKERHAFVGQYLAQNGFAAAVINYRLYPFARWPAFAEDAAAACAFLFEHAQEYGLDRDRIVLAGHSAGGEIAGVIAYDHRWLEQAGAGKLRVRGFIGLSGAYDVRPPIRQLMPIFGNDAATRAAASPIALAGKDAPPTMLCWADQDMLKLDACGRMLAARLRAFDVPVATHVLSGTHASYVWGLGIPSDRLGPLMLEFARDCTAAAPMKPPQTTVPNVEQREVDLGDDAHGAIHLAAPSTTTPRPLLLLAAPLAGGERLLATARLAAEQGTVAVIVPCDPDDAEARLAATCKWLAARAGELHLDGQVTLAGCGTIAATAIAIGTQPRFFAALGTEHAVLRGVLAICPALESATKLAQLRDGIDSSNPPVVLVHGDGDRAAKAMNEALAGRVADLVALPLPEFAFDRWLAGDGDDPLTPVLLGFAGS